MIMTYQLCNSLSNSEKTVGRIALLPQLFCRKLWGSPHRCDSPVHRTAEDATLKAATGTAMPSALSFPALKGEGCRAIGSRFLPFRKIILTSLHKNDVDSEKLQCLQNLADMSRILPLFDLRHHATTRIHRTRNIRLTKHAIFPDMANDLPDIRCV